MSSAYRGGVSGAELALLLLGGYRKLIDGVTAELAAVGHEDFRPVHHFALQAIGAGADSASELGRRLSVSKQAAAKTIAVLLDRRYVERGTDPQDARRKRITVTERGDDVMQQGAAILDRLREEWMRELGGAELATLESQLVRMVGQNAVRVDAPGWSADATE